MLPATFGREAGGLLFDRPNFEKDPIVLLFQAEAFGEKTKSNEVPFELYVKSGAKHGWKNMLQDESKFVAWFDKYLLNY